MTRPVFSILLPSYNSEKIIAETIESILHQTFIKFELIIIDDNSSDNTEKIVKKFQKIDQRIFFFKNSVNIGYSKNLEACRQKAIGDYLYFMGNDDILSPIALEETYKAFQMDANIGAITRPFYSFQNKNVNRVVRIFGTPHSPKINKIISIFDAKQIFLSVYKSVGQLSGLAMKREWVEAPVHEDIFPAHAYPFFSIYKKHKIVHLKDYFVAVRVSSSQTRFLSTIYEPSPTLTWIKMFNTIFSEERFKNQRKWGIDHICQEYVGLIQIKNYSKFINFLKEAIILIRYRWKNLFNVKFWFFTIGIAIIPRRMLILLVDKYKTTINAKKLSHISLKRHFNNNK